jgi:hypothetical protein
MRFSTIAHSRAQICAARPRLAVHASHESEARFRPLRRARRLLVGSHMRAAVILFITLVLTLAACFGPKHPRSGPQGSNDGAGSGQGGPWSGGTTAALTDSNDPSR